MDEKLEMLASIMSEVGGEIRPDLAPAGPSRGAALQIQALQRAYAEGRARGFADAKEAAAKVAADFDPPDLDSSIQDGIATRIRALKPTDLEASGKAGEPR